MGRRIALLGIGSTIAFLAACSASNGGNAFNEGAGGGMGGATTTTTTHAAGPTGTGGNVSIGVGVGGATTGTGASSCNSGPNDDNDHDGFTVAQGDCNDCDPNVNPGAIEVPTKSGDMPADEDCNGVVDDLPQPCDSTISGMASSDPYDGAKAIELCQKATSTGKTWGVVDAQWVRADGSPATTPNLQFGLLQGFGPNVGPQAGTRMLVISSGHARLPGSSSACNTYMCDDGTNGNAPPGFPQDTPGCGGGGDIYDDIGFQMKVRAPTNATGYEFNFRFYSFEYPEYVCSTYNDQFIALVNPPPSGALNGNISFDANHDPVSVNIAFFQTCVGCPLGTAALQGTGFDGSWSAGEAAGATAWLKTQAPVTGGQEVTIRFAIWDTGDHILDSTALIDNFEWVANGGTVTVQTNPDPMPK